MNFHLTLTPVETLLCLEALWLINENENVHEDDKDLAQLVSKKIRNQVKEQYIKEDKKC